MPSSTDDITAAVDPDTIAHFFTAIEKGDAEAVRSFITTNKSLTQVRHKSVQWKYDMDIEMDAYKFLGAYLGQLTGLQLSLLKGHDRIAHDIIDATLDTSDLDLENGGGNTALHMATFLGARDIVRRLLERGCNAARKNAKGFKPMDVLDDEEMRKIYSSADISLNNAE